MSVKRIDIENSPRRQAPMSGGPQAQVLAGVDDGWGLGVVQITVPPGAAMPEHAHGPSATTPIPVAGSVLLVEVDDTGEHPHELRPGSMATIPVDDRVRVENAGAGEARVLVIFDPPDFAAGLAGWPAA